MIYASLTVSFNQWKIPLSHLPCQTSSFSLPLQGGACHLSPLGTKSCVKQVTKTILTVRCDNRITPRVDMAPSAKATINRSWNWAGAKTNPSSNQSSVLRNSPQEQSSDRDETQQSMNLQPKSALWLVWRSSCMLMAITLRQGNRWHVHSRRLWIAMTAVRAARLCRQCDNSTFITYESAFRFSGGLEATHFLSYSKLAECANLSSIFSAAQQVKAVVLILCVPCLHGG